MAFDANEILRKAKEKTQNEKEILEKKLAEEEAAKEQQKILEAQRREQERLQREAEQKRKEETARKEAEEKARREAEERRQLELEKARVQEEVRQKALEQKKIETQTCANEMQNLLSQMKDLINRKEKNFDTLNNLYKKANEQLQKNVDYNQISIFSEFKSTLSNLENLKNKAYSTKQKKQKSKENGKKVAIIIPCIIALCGVVFGIYKLATRPKAQYVVGGRGQGGIIFYDKGEYTDGWRYLEVSITRLPDRYWADDSEINYIRGLKSGLGNGDFNTDNIIRGWGTDSAAWDARNYNGGGYTDWYLPTRDEMQLVYKVAGKKYGKKLQKKIPGFDYINYGNWNTANWKNYWTSEMASAGKAYYYDCNNIGGDSLDKEITTYVFMKKTYYSKNYVRPVRKF